MISKFKIFQFHFFNILKTAQSVMLFLLFALGTMWLVSSLHGNIEKQHVNKSVCIYTNDKRLEMFKTKNLKCEPTQIVEITLNNSSLNVMSSNEEANEIVSNMITTTTINKLGQQNLIPYQKVHTINLNKDESSFSFPIYSLSIFYIIMFSGIILVTSVAVEKINKIRLMTQFKLSSNYLIFVKILSVFTLITTFILLSVATLIYFDSTKYIHLADIKNLFTIKTDLWLTIMIHVTNLIISYYFLAFIGSLVKTQEELQSKLFIGNLVFMTAFFVSMIFVTIPNNIQDILKYVPILSSYVLDKVTNINALLISVIQIVTIVVVIYFAQKKYKEL